MTFDFFEGPSGDLTMLDRRSPRPRVTIQTIVALEDFRTCLRWVTVEYGIPFLNFEEPDYLIKILRGECRSLRGTIKSEEIRRGEVRTSFALHRRAGGDGEPVSKFVGTYVSGRTGFWVPNQVKFISRYSGSLDLLNGGPIQLPSCEDPAVTAERAMTIYLTLRMEKLQGAEGAVPQRTEDEITDCLSKGSEPDPEYRDLARAANDVSIEAHRIRKGIR